MDLFAVAARKHWGILILRIPVLTTKRFHRLNPQTILSSSDGLEGLINEIFDSSYTSLASQIQNAIEILPLAGVDSSFQLGEVKQQAAKARPANLDHMIYKLSYSGANSNGF